LKFENKDTDTFIIFNNVNDYQTFKKGVPNKYWVSPLDLNSWFWNPLEKK
jgi:hypothetical protein